MDGRHPVYCMGSDDAKVSGVKLSISIVIVEHGHAITLSIVTWIILPHHLVSIKEAKDTFHTFTKQVFTNYVNNEN